MAREVVEIEARCRRGHPAFELEEVLDALREPGRHLHWSVEKLYAVGRPALLGRTMWQLGDEISKTPGGLRLSWDELEVLAAGCFQVLDARIVGSERSSGSAAGDVVVEVEWGTHWRFTAHDESVLERCKSLESAAPGEFASDEAGEQICPPDDFRVELDDDQAVGFPC
jgi:hypothetical protein